MDPCSICGSTDLNLVDGFYYCVECGTQDVNVRETIVEQNVLGDGTFAIKSVKRVTTVVKDGVKMSGEWHKWHTFNFILAGLTDELIALGAKPSVKMKVLWIWSRYIKLYQVKDDLESNDEHDIEDHDTTKITSDEEKEDSESDYSVRESKRKWRKSKSDRFIRDIKIVTKGLLLSILYIALNLDRSDIQLSHLLRFIREGRLKLYECMHYVPKELDVNEIYNWKSFQQSIRECHALSIRELSMTCFKKLKLGVPLVPDLRKLVSNYVQELCLPDDFKDLVFALMHYIPTDFLYLDTMIQKSLVRIPDYEGVCMAYILMALKMCFGLDDDYELKVSEEIDKINDKESNVKSYKLGGFSNSCDRLFSFKDWCQHLQLRKFIVCKHYLPMSKQLNSQVDDYVLMEHLEERKKKRIKISDDVTMDILNKVKSDYEPFVIPKDDFPMSLTPMSTYIDLLIQSVEDPDLRLLLCEDFSQYSLRYAIRDLKLPGHSPDKDTSLVGVSKLGKTFNNHVIGTLKEHKTDMSMVYVRYCQNKNWLKTKPPKTEHVAKIGQNENSSDKQQSDKDSDHGYDSNVENYIPASDATHVTINDKSVCTEDKKLEIVMEPDDNKSIFDDNFKDMTTAPSDHNDNSYKEEIIETGFEINTQHNNTMQDSTADVLSNIEYQEDDRMSLFQFNPSTFDKDGMIRELIELARKKYKIPVPKEYTSKAPRKRKVHLAHDKASCSDPKKKRTENRVKPGQANLEIDKLLSAYYTNVRNDILNQVSEHVKSLIGNIDRRNVLDASNITENPNDLNESNVNQDEVNDSCVLNEENEESQRERDTNHNVEENSQDLIRPITQNEHDATVEENIEDEVEELFLKSAPNFDEKDHDIRQLYVKLKEDTTNISMGELDDDPEIDKIIQRSRVEKNKIDDVHDSSESDDDIPLIVLKESNYFEQDRKKRKKEKLKPLIRDRSSVKKFRYWVRHYKAKRVVKSRNIAMKFDMELYENLPVSFVFVIRECAGILGCSQYCIYKNLQNIEDILIANNNYKN